MGVAEALIYAGDFGLVRRYKRRLGRWPRVANPRLYSERMLWRKLVDRNPLFVTFADKLATKDFIRERCPELPLARVLWVGADADAIPAEVLRGDVFLKANHGCDFNRRIRNGEYDRAELRELTRRWLGSVYGRKNGEWGYGQVRPTLFVEEAIGDISAGMLEFNVRASNGHIILGSVLGDCKTPRQWSVYLDAVGEPACAMQPSTANPPAGFDARRVLEPYRRAVDLTRRLSVGVDYARFDFLWNGRELYGGEITVFPAGGVADAVEPATNALILDGWDMAQSHFLSAPQTGWKRWYVAALKRQLKSASANP